MENLSMRQLIELVAGDPLPGETPGKLLHRVHKMTGLNLRTLRAGWYDESNGSLETRTILKEKAVDNEQELASRAERLALAIERSGHDQEIADAARDVACRLRRLTR